MPIFDLIKNNEFNQLAQQLAADHSQITSQNKDGDTPIIYAAKLKRWECVDLIIKTVPFSQIEAIDPDFDKDAYGCFAYAGYYVAYSLAREAGKRFITRLIASQHNVEKHKTEIEKSYRKYQLYSMVGKKEIDNIKSILSNRPRNIWPSFFLKAINYIHSGDEAVVLIEAAIHYGDITILKAVFSFVSATKYYSSTALHALAHSCRNSVYADEDESPLIEIVMYLRHSGGDITAHETAIIENGSRDLLQLYLNANDISNPLEDHLTIIERAIKADNWSLAQELLDHHSISHAKLLILLKIAAGNQQMNPEEAQWLWARCFTLLSGKIGTLRPSQLNEIITHAKNSKLSCEEFPPIADEFEISLQFRKPTRAFQAEMLHNVVSVFNEHNQPNALFYITRKTPLHTARDKTITIPIKIQKGQGDNELSEAHFNKINEQLTNLRDHPIPDISSECTKAITDIVQKLGHIQTDRPLDERSDSELYRIKQFLKSIEPQNGHNADWVAPIIGFIQSIIDYIDKRYKKQITFEFISSLIDAYERHKKDGKSLIQKLFVSSESINKLYAFMHTYATPRLADPLTDDQLKELYKIIQKRKIELAKDPREDYFHLPKHIVNQLFFKLCWMLGRIEGFDLNTMLPEHRYGVDEWFERVGQKPYHSHLYEFEWNDIYIDKMYPAEKKPAVFAVSELKEEYQLKSQLSRDLSQVKPVYFSDSQVQTLFRERPEFPDLCTKLYANEVKGVAKIRLSTVNELERLGKEIYDYSNHTPDRKHDTFSGVIFDKFIFSEEHATQLLSNLVIFLEALPLEEKVALENLHFKDRNLKTMISSIKLYGCTGLVGEFTRDLANFIRESNLISNSRASAPESLLCRHYKLIDPVTQPPETLRL